MKMRMSVTTGEGFLLAIVSGDELRWEMIGGCIVAEGHVATAPASMASAGRRNR